MSLSINRLRLALMVPTATKWGRISRCYLSLQHQEQVVATTSKPEVSSSLSSEISPTSATNNGYPYTEGLVASRHGPGDAVICLNVGGKEFVTLRSTVSINPVLTQLVLQAEANEEFVHGKAVFIDRQSESFGLILAHLRNQADRLENRSMASKSMKLKRALGVASPSSPASPPSKFGGTLIQIPEDKAKMRDLYVEARYFQISELEKVLCGRSLYLQLASFVSGSGNSNPFQEATQVLNTLRRALLATGGVGIFVGRDNIGDVWNDAKSFLLGRKAMKDMAEEVKKLPPSSGNPSLA